MDALASATAAAFAPRRGFVPPDGLPCIHPFHRSSAKITLVIFFFAATGAACSAPDQGVSIRGNGCFRSGPDAVAGQGRILSRSGAALEQTCPRGRARGIPVQVKKRKKRHGRFPMPLWFRDSMKPKPRVLSRSISPWPGLRSGRTAWADSRYCSLLLVRRFHHRAAGLPVDCAEGRGLRSVGRRRRGPCLAALICHAAAHPRREPPRRACLLPRIPLARRSRNCFHWSGVSFMRMSSRNRALARSSSPRA